jgi:hypothetical protein
LKTPQHHHHHGYSSSSSLVIVAPRLEATTPNTWSRACPLLHPHWKRGKGCPMGWLRRVFSFHNDHHGSGFSSKQETPSVSSFNIVHHGNCSCVFPNIISTSARCSSLCIAQLLCHGCRKWIHVCQRGHARDPRRKDSNHAPGFLGEVLLHYTIQ